MHEESPSAERRLVLRVLAYWRDICDGREFPTPEDIDPAQIGDIWPHCFVLRLDGGAGAPMFERVGAAIAAASPSDLTDRPISEAEPDSLIDHATYFFDEVLHRRVPVTRGGAFPDHDGTTVLYRSILLPLSDNGSDVTALFGAANCREFVKEQIDTASPSPGSAYQLS